MQMVHFIPPAQRRIAMEMAVQIESPILIYGPEGSGKGEIARWIHTHGPLASKPYVVLRKSEPFLNELFSANTGTIVIPEITELNFSEQRSLLDLIDSHSLPIATGSEMRRIARVRVIAMTSFTENELAVRGQGGMFSFALIQRMSRNTLLMPTLSDRKEEFSDIVQILLSEITRELHKEYLKTITPNAWKLLKDYSWPGNLRELRNVLRYAAVRATRAEIDETHLPVLQNERSAHEADSNSLSLDFRKTREAFEKVYLAELLRSVNGDLQVAAERTGIAPGLLRDKVILHDLTNIVNQS